MIEVERCVPCCHDAGTDPGPSRASRVLLAATVVVATLVALAAFGSAALWAYVLWPR